MVMVRDGDVSVGIVIASGGGDCVGGYSGVDVSLKVSVSSTEITYE